jgi:flagellar motor switch protein FliG
MPPPKPVAPKEDELKGIRRAAAFMLSLDPATAAVMMQKFSDREVAMLSEEMTRMGELRGADSEKLLKEFNTQTGGDRTTVEPMLQEILERALGKEKARELLDKIKRQTRESEPFRALLPLDAKQVQQIIRGEHPQVLGIVISHLEPPVAAELLRDMDEDLRYDVIKRIAATADLPNELIRQIDEMMEVRAFSLSKRGLEPPADARFKTVAQMLNVSDPSLTKSVLERLNKEQPALANEIQALMFVFEDLVKIDAKGMQKVLAEVDKADLTLSLRAAPPEIKNKLLDNLSSRAREAIMEEMELMGPKPLSEIEAAQKRILQLVRGMEERGELMVNRGGGEQLL